ncbi:MAG: ABC transporter substrate-binding protein [Candidatus Lernaella stagnicola]|nr:ABC transporter substrate-binding protein [Candidatus Lernaella stagnicola]
MAYKTAVFAGCLFLLLFVFSACAGSPPPPADTLRIALEGNPTNLDPRFATDAYSVRILALVYEGLLAAAADGSVEPALAESYEILDERTYRFRLREGLAWQDGQPITSRDVATNFRFLADPENKCPVQDTFRRITSIDTPDDRTVILHLDEVFAPFLDKMTRPLVPAHRLTPDSLADDPVGSGPYKLTEFRRGELVVLEASENYRKGKARIPRIEFRVIGNDTTRLLRIRKGDVDLVQNAVPPFAVKFLSELPGRRVIRETGVNYSYLGFNLQDKRGLVDKIKVRQAVAHAIDRHQIIDSLMFGMARPATGLLAPSNWAYEPDVPTYPYDPARAKRLLDEAGFPDPDGDGPALRFTLSYKTSTNKLRMRIAEVMAQQLSEVGIGFERRSLEWGTFFQDIKSGNFQTYTLTWVGVTDPDILHYIFHSSMQPPRGANRGRYVNAQVDRWLEDTRREPDRDKRREQFSRVQKQLAADCVYVSLWWADNVVVHTNRLRGFFIRPGGDYLSLAGAELVP